MKIVCIKAKSLCLSIAALALATAMFIGMYTAGRYAINAFSVSRSLPVYSVERTDKKLSISFDCAWGVEHTDDILKELDRHGVRCTFFAVEFWVEKYPEYAKKIVEQGHELATHSKTHPHMSELSEEKIREELLSSKTVIEQTTGQKVTLFRPPFGDYNNLLIETSLSLGLLPIQWDVDSLAWKNLSATEIALRIINAADSGSIILSHNNGLHTAEALPTVFSTLQNRGYEFVPIGELVYKENYVIDPTGKQKING